MDDEKEGSGIDPGNINIISLIHYKKKKEEECCGKYNKSKTLLKGRKKKMPVENWCITDQKP